MSGRIRALCLGLLVASGPALARGVADTSPQFYARVGLGKYFGSLENVLAVGPSYGLAVTFFPAAALGIELGYEGARSEYIARLVADDGDTSALWRNAGYAMLRVGIPAGILFPYLGAGWGISHSTSSGPGTDVIADDLLMEVPLAIGIDVRSGNFVGGLRLTYRFLLDQGFVRTSDEALTTGGFGDLVLTLGGRF